MTDDQAKFGLTYKQYETLSRPLNGTRIAKRSQGGQQLSYLESWDVRAHLIRIFGYGGFDAETIEYHPVATREYLSKGDPERNIEPKQMVEVIYSARVKLVVKDHHGWPFATYVECSCGSASGPANMLGEHHDNALKTAVSDALKRCAINLGNQFGLSLYDKGSTRDVIKGTLVKPEQPDTVEVRDGDGNVVATVPTEDGLSDEQKKVLKDSLGAELVPEEPQAPEGSSGHGNATNGEEPATPPAEVKA